MRVETEADGPVWNPRTCCCRRGLLLAYLEPIEPKIRQTDKHHVNDEQQSLTTTKESNTQDQDARR